MRSWRRGANSDYMCNNVSSVRMFKSSPGANISHHTLVFDTMHRLGSFCYPGLGSVTVWGKRVRASWDDDRRACEGRRSSFRLVIFSRSSRTKNNRGTQELKETRLCQRPRHERIDSYSPCDIFRWLSLAPSVARRVATSVTPSQGRGASSIRGRVPFAHAPVRPGPEPRRTEPTPRTRTLGFDSEPT